MVFVERAFVLWHSGVVLPRFGNHEHDCLGQAAAGVEQHFHRVVEVAGVGTVWFGNREQFAEVIAPHVTLHHPLPRAEPVVVAAEGVDFAVVAHEPTRLCAVPAGERVGGEAGVNHGQVALVVVFPQVVEEVRNLVRGEHALVDDDFG